MAKQFKTERAAQQQKLICQGLIALMERMPYSHIAVTDICGQTGLPRRTFYYYFESKEEVLDFIIQGLLEECDLESMLLCGRTKASLEQALTRFFLYWRDHRRQVLKVLVQNGLEQELIMRCMNWVRSEARWDDLMAQYTEEEQSISILLGITAVLYALFHWCSRDFAQSPEYMAACVSRILTNPLYPTE